MQKPPERSPHTTQQELYMLKELIVVKIEGHFIE